MTILQELQAKRLLIGDAELRDAYGASLRTLRDLGIVEREDVRQGLAHPDLRHRTMSCWAAGELGERDALEQLWSIVITDADLAFESANAIVKITSEDPSAIARFVAIVKNRDFAAVARAAAAHQLGFAGSDNVAETLIEILSDSSDNAEVRAHCAEALGSLRARAALFPLMNALRDPNTEVRFWSAYALGELRDPRAVASLEEVASQDDQSVRNLGSVGEEARRAVQEIKSSS